MKLTVDTLARTDLDTAWADGSMGFDFGGTYTRVVPKELIEARRPGP